MPGTRSITESPEIFDRDPAEKNENADQKDQSHISSKQNNSKKNDQDGDVIHIEESSN